MTGLQAWLASIGLGRHAEVFRQNGIEIDVVGDVSEDDLIRLGLSLGDRIRLKRALAKMPDRDRPPSATYSEWAGSAAERRRLTVLFCDLVGSTDLSTRLDPEDMREVIGRYLDVVSATVARFGGHVARLIGDGILVYFGWPQAHEEQVERSVIAGLELIANVAGLELAPELRLSCRVGIATGEVVVGEMASSNDPREAVVGSTPNLAARLQGFAEPGQLLIDEATKIEISASFRVEAVGPLDIRGFAEKVSAWRVVEASTQETRFARRDHGVSPLIGRETELALLLDRWRRAAAGKGQVVLVCGEAGIGKSRLVEALADSIGPAATFDRLGYQCAPLHSDTPLYPIMQQMTRVFGFAPQESVEQRRAKLDAALRPLFPDKPDVIERFASLFSLPVDKLAAPRGEPPSLERKRIREALIELTLRHAKRQPLVAVLEDAQWADPTTERVFQGTISALTQAPILLVITSREPPRPSWFAGTHVSILNLVRLDLHESAAIVRGTAGTALDERIVDRIAERADGVPLFIEEMTKAVLENHSSVVEGDQRDHQARADQLPTTLQASLNSRLDRLEGAKWVAQAGAVIGREFSIRLLARVLDRAPSELDRDLERVSSSGLVQRRGGGDTATLRFKHALVHEAAYRTLLGADRKRLHARVLDCYEALFPQQLEQAAEDLALHASGSERWDKAADYLSLAYANASRRAATREAINIFNRAIDALARLPEEVAAVRAIDLRLHAFATFHIAGANDKLIELIREAERVAERIGDRRRLVAAGAQTAFALWLNGKHDEAQARAEAVLTMAEMPADFPIVIAALFNLANIYHAKGRIAEAVGLHRRMLGMLQGGLSRKRFGWSAPPGVLGRAFCAWYLLDLGEIGPAAAMLEEAEALSSPAEPHGRVMVDTGRGILAMHRGEHASAVEILRPTLSLSQRGEVLTMYPMVAACLGRALCSIGRVEEALSVLNDAVRRETYRFGGKYTWIHLRLALAQACRLSFLLARADNEVQLARQIAEECGEVVHQAYGALEEGHIALARHDGELALARAQAALEVARPLGLRPFVAECLGLAAEAQTELRRLQDAAASRAEARALRAAMGLDGGAASVEAVVKSA
jgi:class 3 adenylate cyclase/tetratricopeptide (TPR) repeat protein